VRTADDLDGAFGLAVRNGAEGLLVLPSASCGSALSRLPTPGMERQDDAQVRQPAGVVMNELVSVQPVEVLVSDVPVPLAVAEHVPGDHHDGVAHGRDAVLGSAPASQAVIVGGQIVVSGLDSAPGALDQRGAQPAVALARPT
jgi:hypothetical protein